MALNRHMMELLKTLLLVFGLSHLIACVWVYIGTLASEDGRAPSCRFLGIADGMSIARVWTCRYSK